MTKKIAFTPAVLLLLLWAPFPRGETKKPTYTNPVIDEIGPTDPCVIFFDGKLWHVYHQQKDGSKPWNRFLCIDPLWFDEKGVLHGKATRGTPQPAPATPRK